jgi:glycine dehydrogenase
MNQPALPSLAELENDAEFRARHLGPDAHDEQRMLAAIGVHSRSALIDALVPADILRAAPMDLPAPATEAAALAELKAIAGRNRPLRSFIGQGYHGCHTPGVILRNILENPAWYTAYTPYQAEISQGRMEALVNFQTLVTDLTGLAIANASMLDEATAAAEAMTLAKRSVKSKSNVLVVSGDMHPQILEVLATRAAPLGLQLVVADSAEAWDGALDGELFAAMVQYPASSGWLHDWSADAARVHRKGGAFIVGADPLALTLLKPPGEFGADIAFGSTQRFGMPMGAGGPHAAYLACRDEFKRSMPGRLVGVSVDSHGHTAYRLALQTREQHIRREKATSNICTAQVLPAVIASMYAVYHGPAGLKRIALRVATYTAILAKGLSILGWPSTRTHHLEYGVFDTVCLKTGADTDRLLARAVERGANLRRAWGEYLCISLDETTTRADLALLWDVFAPAGASLPTVEALAEGIEPMIPHGLRRSSAYLTHPVFNTHHSETEMLRYIRSLSDQDLALDRSMIPLGSCTMKLNATAEMIPITWPEFAHIHPFAPADQLAGYAQLNEQLCNWLSQATGYAGISLQPNAGSQGEYAGLLVIRAWHASRGESHRDICLIPESAHGTNPASAQMVGLQVVVTQCDKDGNIDLADLRAKCEAAPRPAGRNHDHLPLDLRRVRHPGQGDLRAGACARRPGLRGRRQHERAGRRGRAGPVRRRCVAPEPAQDLLHPARRRRPGRRPGLRGRGPRALPARPSQRTGPWRLWWRGHRAAAGPPQGGERPLGGQRGAVSDERGGCQLGPSGQRCGAADQLDVHPSDGRRGPEAGHRDRHPERQLRGRAPGRRLRHPLQRRHRRRRRAAAWPTSASSTCAR